MKCTIIITLIMMISEFSLAQENNTHLILMNRATLNNIFLEELIDDSVKIFISGQYQWVKVDSIAGIKKTKKSKFWKGAGIGFLSGAVAGSLIGLIVYSNKPSSSGSFDLDLGPGFSAGFGAAAGGIAGALVGGAIGSSAGRDEFYDLSQKNTEQKIEIIKSIMAEKNK